MDFDQYWKNLIHRVHRQRAVLVGNEEVFFRLSCIYGETMVDGIESYFERRFDEFAPDMIALRNVGFGELASEFELARRLLFGSAPLDRKTVEARIMLLDETEQSTPILAEIDKIYDRIIPQLEELADYKHSFGLKAALFSDS